MKNLPSKSELVSMISKIMNADGTEEELDILLSELKDISMMPDISDLIFYPQEEKSAEEIADVILNYKPLRLG